MGPTSDCWPIMILTRPLCRPSAGAVTINLAPVKVWAAECAAPTAHNLLASSKVKVTVESEAAYYAVRNGLKVAMKGGCQLHPLRAA